MELKSRDGNHLGRLKAGYAGKVLSMVDIVMNDRSVSQACCVLYNAFSIMVNI